MNVFDTKDDFTAHLKAQAQDAVPDDIAQALSAGVAQSEGELRDVDSPVDGLNLRVGQWVLRDSDVPVLEAITMAGAALGAVAAPGAIAVGTVLAGLTAFAKFVWSAWRRSSRLTRDEIAVLGILHTRGALSQDDLTTLALDAFPQMTAAQVAQTLLSLQDIELLNGDIIELIRKDASGRWRIRHG